MMAYCPIAHNQSMRMKLVKNQLLIKLSQKYEITPEQLLLYFVLQQENVLAIPKAGTPAHVRENAKVIELKLLEEDLIMLEKEFPAPKRKTELDML